MQGLGQLIDANRKHNSILQEHDDGSQAIACREAPEPNQLP